jgi:hypothetical protein
VTSRRFWAALLTLGSTLALAAASASEQPAPGARPTDAGPARSRDAAPPPSAPGHDGGHAPRPFTLEDVEVVENLDLLQHLPESEVLDMLLPLHDE